MRDGYPDHVRFRCGDTFDAEDDPSSDLFPNKTGRSSLARAVLYWYGDESLDRPVLYEYDFSNSKKSTTFSLGHYHIAGLEFKASGSDPYAEDFALNATVIIDTGTDSNGDFDFPDGYVYTLRVHGIDEVGVRATHVLNRAVDTPASIADDLVSQLGSVVGLTFTRSDPSATRAFILMERTVVGTQRFFCSEAEHHAVDVAQIKLGTFGLYGNIFDLIIEDCVLTGVMIQTRLGGSFQPSDIQIKRCIHKDIWIPFSNTNLHPPSGVFAENTNGLKISECVNDYGGYHKDYPQATRNKYAHGYYIQYTCDNAFEFLDNVVLRPCSHGIHGRAGGVFTDNFFGRAAVSLQMGYDNAPLSVGEIALAHNNVISEVQSMYTGNFYDGTLGGPSGAMWGLPIFDAWDATVERIGNIVCNRVDPSLDNQWQGLGKTLSYRAYGITYNDATPPTSNVIDQDNIVYKMETPDQNGTLYPNGDDATLGHYYAQLRDSGVVDELRASGFLVGDETGDDDFDSGANLFKMRRLKKWDTRVSAPSVNVFCKQKFEV